MKKQEVLELLEQFPDDNVDTEELMRGLYLKSKLEDAEDAVERGDVVSHDEVVKRSQTWFK
ncbi:MAG TPA: hypothetical protein VND64_18860 [Pirellulales bacterium]|nr:hypothetical protein [Pirellulales bacterium]